MASRILSRLSIPRFGLALVVGLLFSSGDLECRAVVVLDQAHVLPPFQGAFGQSVSSTNMLAQTFTVGQAGTLAQLDLAISVADFATGDLVFSLHPTTNGVPNSNVNGALFSTTVPLSSIDEFTLDDVFTASVDVSSAGLFVQPGDQLAWTLDRPNPTEEFVFVHAGGNEYVGGDSFRRSFSTSSWIPTNGADRFFRTFVDTDATGGSLMLDPTVAATVELEEGEFVLDADPFSLYTFQSLTSNIDARSILEFPITSIPENAKLTSAKLELDVGLHSSQSNGTEITYPSVPIFAYEGDGFASVNDALIPPRLLAVTDEITTNGPISVDLELEYVESLIGNASHLGLVLVGDVNRLQVGFDNFTDRPVLKLEFDFLVPGDFDLDQDVDGADFLRWQRGKSVDALGLSDLTEWQTSYGEGNSASTALNTLPEPSSWLLAYLVLCGLLAQRYRFAGKLAAAA